MHKRQPYASSLTSHVGCCGGVFGAPGIGICYAGIVRSHVSIVSFAVSVLPLLRRLPKHTPPQQQSNMGMSSDDL